MSAELAKMISAMLVALLVVTNTSLDANQLTALYKCGFWDGTEIATKDSIATVKDDQLVMNGKKVGTKITKLVQTTIAEDNTNTMDGGEIIAESIYEGSPVKWVAFYTDNKIDIWSEKWNNYIAVIRIPTEKSWTTKVADEYISVYEDGGKKILEIELATGYETFFE